MTDHRKDYQHRLAEYRRRLGEVAIDAQQKLGLTPIDTAGTFWGIGRGIIAAAYGDESADEWFRAVVQSMDGDDGEDDPKPNLRVVQ